MNEEELDYVNQAFQTVQFKAKGFNIPFGNDSQLDGLIKMLEGFSKPKILLLGIDPLLGQHSGYAYVENNGDGNYLLVQFAKPSAEVPNRISRYNLFHFKGDPPAYQGHYSNCVNGSANPNQLTKDRDVIDDASIGRIVPIISALGAAYHADVRPDVRRN